MAANPLTLASDNSPRLLPLLRSNDSLASTQDDHGYSLLHAAASYNHVDLLRTLVNEFHVNVNVKDEDGETPLFVVETVEAAQVLIEELGADATVKNGEGETAEEKILSEGEHPTIAAFLKETRLQIGSYRQEREAENGSVSASNGPFVDNLHSLPPLPPNVTVNLGAMEEDQSAEPHAEADPKFSQRIEELAARDDFQGEEGQKQLRGLITDAVKDVSTDSNEREVRRRLQ